MPLSISPVPVQMEKVKAEKNKEKTQALPFPFPIIPERRMSLRQFVLYRSGVRFMKWGYWLQSFAEDKHGTTN